MSECLLIRVNDQYQCSCGLQWDVDEADPHVPAQQYLNGMTNAQKLIKKIESPVYNTERTTGNTALDEIKQKLKGDSDGSL